MYNLNIERLVRLLLPKFFRQSNVVDLLLVPFKGIEKIINELKQYRENTIYFTQFNSQTIVLQHLLNDIFDPQYRRIYIVNTANIIYPYVYNKIENQIPLYFYNKSENKPQILKLSEEYYSQYDFIVFVPAQLYVNISILKRYIDYYKVAGKLYNIQTY